ncbi:NADH pyrophosphatase [Mangrovactinospora gilvigrisea]|uniref:NAD(+) diphosphatase n=1 Tax=Mangrovactinospora gilvigrisea TaxID=1428644 RepID=A0A1J7BER8_9ACTN|nr:NAD(+) diphosphatase [Mangrovactinospora gilvigrisea]OIV37191.1 NADH pyrophosphatase [Mangrovactinospora gilvigrisea]
MHSSTRGSDHPVTVTRAEAERPPLALSRSSVDRGSEHRLDEPWLAAAWSNPGTRVLVVSHGTAFVLDVPDGDAPAGTGTHAGTGAAELVLLPSFEAPQDGDRYFLGTDTDGVHYFALAVDELPGRLDGAARPAGLREVGGTLGDRDAGLLVHAVALENWHSNHRFCARCGQPTAPAAAGHVRRCAACGTEHYPRTDPAVIMLVTDDQDRALLGTQKHWEGRYSTLAGFVEPGEPLEAAVAREVHEETGVHVVSATYVDSQPWPFPCSLMLGYMARADSTEITVDGEEIAHARWFSRDELKASVEAGEISLPGKISIARRLLEIWYGGPIDAPGADRPRT